MRVGIVAGVLAVVLLAGCREALHQGLAEGEANEVLASLREVGIDASKRSGTGREPTWTIEVPRDQQAAAVRHLEAQGLPRRRARGMSAVLEGGAMVPTPTEERLKEGHLLAEQAVLAIEQLEGVALARVQLSLPHRARPGQLQGDAKASVLVKARPGMGGQLESMRGAIEQLVAGGVEGLSARDVAVVVQALRAPPPPVEKRAAPAASIKLKLALALSCVLVLGLVGVVLLMVLRARRTALEQARIPTPAAGTPKPRLTGSQPVRAVTPVVTATKGGVS